MRKPLENCILLLLFDKSRYYGRDFGARQTLGFFAGFFSLPLTHSPWQQNYSNQHISIKNTFKLHSLWI